MMRKNIAGMALTVAMAGAFLTGCGGNPEVNEQESAQESSVEALTVKESSVEVSTFNESSIGVSITDSLIERIASKSSLLEDIDMEAIYKGRTTVDDAASFEGKWHATNTHSGDSGDVEITQQTDEGFRYRGLFFHGPNIGDIEGTAYYLTPNLAISSQDDIEYSISEGYMLFLRKDDSLYVKRVGLFADMGWNVNPDNEYTKGEPVYTNEGILEKTYTQDELDKIHELIGDDLYEYPFIECTKFFIVESSEKTISDGIKCKYVQCFMSGIREHYNVILTEDGRIYIEISEYMEDHFFTNDPEWTLEELPDIND